jgi:hypothetical protein
LPIAQFPIQNPKSKIQNRIDMWAILSGIEGNLAAYEAVIADIKRQRLVEALYILGDLVGPTPESEKLVERVREPRRGELEPLVCKGWWEEQCLILHALGAVGEPTELMAQYGGDTVKLLWDNVSRPTVQWLRGLDFGFSELDCLLIHGTTVSVSEGRQIIYFAVGVVYLFNTNCNQVPLAPQSQLWTVKLLPKLSVLPRVK